jgi:peptidoglycan/xylan/chitin deacetylase (PgdA/CDA1 family)
MFHYIGAPIIQGVGEDLFLSKKEFVKTLDFVCSSLQPLEPFEFLTALRRGNLPTRATLLTFDDCTERTVTECMPELQARNLKACFFVNPGLIDAGRTVPCLDLMKLCAACDPGTYEFQLPQKLSLTVNDVSSRAACYRTLWPNVIACPSPQQPEMLHSFRRTMGVDPTMSDDVRLAPWPTLDVLHSAGMLVANHTPFHSTIQADGVGLFIKDVAQAYETLESRFGRSPRIFCYPYGRTLDASPEASRALSKLETEYAFVTQGGLARANCTGLLNLRREGAVYSAGSTKLAPLLALMR